MLSRYLKTALLCCGLLLMAASAYAQDKDIPKELYSAAGIPDSLKTDANSVVRYSIDNSEVKGPGKITIKHHSLITILNEKGDEEAFLRYQYNKKFDIYSYIDVHVYDKDGKMIKKYRKSDMYDVAASSDEVLVGDDRILALRHTVTSYPETIEVEYEEVISSTIGLRDWGYQGDEQSVQEAYYNISISSSAGFRYFDKNTTVKPEKVSNGTIDIYRWKVSNIKAFKLEDQAMPWTVLPVVEFSQDKFEYYGNPGEINTWQNYGKWQLALNSDVCTLSPERAAQIKAMTDSIKTDKAKAKFLYEYMQKNMRYVAIELGIGGLKPFAATFVDEKKYGDCKALVNYMSALLKAANIKSYYVKINAGTNAEPVSYAFPYDFTNHIILCVPFKNDTTWLECTSSNAEFGRLGPFTENRNGLMITEDGGRLVNTPKSKAKDNQFNCEVHIDLQADGGAKAKVKIKGTGEYRFEYLGLAAAKLDEQKEYWQRDLDMKQPSSFDYEPGKDTLYTKYIDLNLDYDKFADVMAGDKQFYRPMVFPLWRFTAPIVEKPRVNDFYLDFPLQKSCITTIDLPQGFEVESLPANASLKFTYGTYDLTYVYNKDKNQVIGTAKFVLNSQVIPAAKYNEMQEYFDSVAKAQNKKLVIKKKA